MMPSVFKPVDRILITKYLSTARLDFQKLFKSTKVVTCQLQTWLNIFQMIDSKQKIWLVHRNVLGLSTIAIH